MVGRPAPRANAIAFIGLCFGVVSLAAALLAQGGRLDARLDVLANLAPLWLAGAMTTGALGAMMPRGGMRRRLLVLSAAGALVASILMAPEAMRPAGVAIAGPRSAATLKLIQFNTWDRNADVPGTADWITRQRPDLVLIEEAEAPISSALAARGFRLTGGIGHVAIFSHQAPRPNTVPISIPLWHALPPFARAEFGVGDLRYAVIAVHLTRETVPGAGESREALLALLNRYDRRRMILAGDFNLTSWSFVLRRWERGAALERLDRGVLSWPAKLNLGRRAAPVLPLLPIDHVYAGPGWRTVSIESGPALGSDHLPLVVTLALSRGAE